MKKIKIILVFMNLCCLLAFTAFGQENKKLAQTGFQFLSVDADARASALGSAMTAVELQSGSLFFNPAGMANMSGFVDIVLSKNNWIADINHNAVSLAINPARGRFGVFGFSLQSVDYGNLTGTRVANTSLGYEVTGNFFPSAFAAGIGYAKALTDRFSVGGQLKYAHQALGESLIPLPDSASTTLKNELSPFAYDFGTMFKTGFKSLTFGMSVRNFSKEIEYDQESFQLPLVFSLGISMNLFDLLEMRGPAQSAIFSIDATHYRSHPEQVRVGIDYTFVDFLSLRLGYIANNDEDGLAYGFGVSRFGLSFDYAFTPFGVFDNVQRFTIRFSL